MIFNKEDNFPDNIMFFNPNWFSYQIMDSNLKGEAIIGCNDEAHIIDINKNIPITSLTIKIPDLIQIRESNEKKISAVYCDEDYFIFTTLKGFISIYDNKYNNIYKDLLTIDFEIILIKKLPNTDSDIELLLTDKEENYMFLKYFDNDIDTEILKRRGVLSKLIYLDLIFIENNYFIVKVNNLGYLSIYLPYFDFKIYEELLDNSIINAHFILENELLNIYFITKEGIMINKKYKILDIISNYYIKENYTINYKEEFIFSYRKIFMNIKTPHLPNNNILKNYNIHNRVKIIEDDKIILTSIDGNIYFVNISKLNENKLIIDIENKSNDIFVTLESNPHYKNIYFVTFKNNNLFILGMDRIISFWKYSNEEFNMNFNIKCLGSKVIKIKSSIIDRNNIMMICNDKTMKLWNIGKQNNSFVSSVIWRGINKRNVFDFLFHNCYENLILCFGDKEIFIYDYYLHNIINGLKLYINEYNVLFSKMLKDNFILKYLDKIFNIYDLFLENKSICQKINHRYANYKNNLIDKYQTKLILFTENKGLWYIDFNTQEFINYYHDYFEKIKCFDIFFNNNDLYIIHGDDNGNILIIYLYNDEIMYHYIKKVHSCSINGIKFGILNDNKIKFASFANDKTIILFEITLNSKINNLKPYLTINSHFKILDIKFSPFDYNILMGRFYKLTTFQIWNISIEEMENRELFNIRGHKGYITDIEFSTKKENVVISSSDDQTVKVWNIYDIKNNKIIK